MKLAKNGQFSNVMETDDIQEYERYNFFKFLEKIFFPKFLDRGSVREIFIARDIIINVFKTTFKPVVK